MSWPGNRAITYHVARVRQLVIDEFSPGELARLAAAAERTMARINTSGWLQELG